ncbi:Pol protein [Phytophthora palmivora]|uniref:Pol protein n=1 Tax=Phytophthora palmivora TaxID=4796 RepID=A0A2P4XJU1_9STRA|nr:Pol protein [Phytophthora palmivora]
MYKWVAHYVKTCGTCQRVKPSGHASAPLQSLPVPADCWKSMSLDFVFGLPADDKGNLMFVCRLSKMVHLAPVRDKVTGKQAAQLFLDSLVNRVLEDTLRSICAEAPRPWSDQLPMVEFALNNAVHASTGFTPFYLNGHPQVPLTLRGGAVASIVSEGDARKAFSSLGSDIEPESLKRQLSSFGDARLTLISLVGDAMASAQNKQNEYSDKQRGNLSVFKEGELVLLDTKNLPLKVVSSVESNKLKHHFIGPFAVLTRHGAAYTIDLPKSMATHPTFYVGRLKRGHLTMHLMA